jgi:hypothetical protein
MSANQLRIIVEWARQQCGSSEGIFSSETIDQLSTETKILAIQLMSLVGALQSPRSSHWHN